MPGPAPSIPPEVATSSQPDHRAFWQSLLLELVDTIPTSLEASKETAGGWFAEVAAAVVELFVEITAELGRRVGQGVDEWEKTAGPLILQAAARGLSDYFGVSVSAGELDPSRPFSERFRFAEQLGRVTLDQMFGAFASPKGLSPEAGLDNAERLLGFNIATALESWLGKVVGTAPLTRFIPNWADLDDVLSANLGLGRANRRVLGPLLNTLIVEPLTWDLNRRFAPARLSVSELLRLHNRGQIDDVDYAEQMQQHGISEWMRGKLEVLATQLPGASDVSRMLELELIDAPRAQRIFRGLGFSDEAAEIMTTLAVEDRVRTLHTTLETLARDMYRDREIDEAEFRSLLETAGRGPLEVSTLLAIGAIERSRPRPLPRGDIEEGFRRGLVPLSRLRAYYAGFGFSLEDQVLLEELAVLDRLEAEKREEREKLRATGSDFRAVPAGQIVEAYVEGRIGSARLRIYYEGLGYAPDDVALLLDNAGARKTERDRKLEEALEKAKTPAFRELSKSDAEEAFIRDVIDAGRLLAYYEASAVAPGDVPVLLELARQKKRERAERLADELARARSSQFADVSRSVIEEAFYRGRIDEARLHAWYEARPFRASEIGILLDLARLRKAERTAAAAAKASPATA